MNLGTTLAVLFEGDITY